MSALQYLWDAEIPQFDLVIFREEDVLTLQISVEYFLRMDVFQGETQLAEPIKDLLMIEYLPINFCFLDLLGQITLLCKVHNDAKPALVQEWFIVLDYIRMVKGFQDVDLSYYKGYQMSFTSLLRSLDSLSSIESKGTLFIA